MVLPWITNRMHPSEEFMIPLLFFWFLNGILAQKLPLLSQHLNFFLAKGLSAEYMGLVFQILDLRWHSESDLWSSTLSEWKSHYQWTPLSWYMCGCAEKFLWEETELRVSRLDMTQKILFSKYPVPVTALKLSGVMKLFHYAYRFCGQEFGQDPLRIEHLCSIMSGTSAGRTWRLVMVGLSLDGVGLGPSGDAFIHIWEWHGLSSGLCARATIPGFLTWFLHKVGLGLLIAWLLLLE